MLKKGIMLLILGLIFSSCDLLNYAIQDNIYRIERERERKELSKKDGPGAIVVDKYKEGVEEATKDIIKRPINKRVEFEGISLTIPENTIINSKGDLVDMKTGSEMFITFSLESGCLSKTVNGKRCGLYYHELNDDVNKIAEKIIKINGFRNTCKY